MRAEGKRGNLSSSPEQKNIYLCKLHDKNILSP
jgi:hypothetical protein